MKKIKAIDFIVWATLILYIGYFCLSYIDLNTKEKEYKILYESLLAQSINFNDILNQRKEQGFQTESEEQLFYDGKSAVVYAYNKLYNCTSYEVEILGPVSAGSAGIMVDVQTHGYQILYPDGTFLYESQRYEPGNTYGQTKGVQYVFKDNDRYYRETTNISYNNGNMSASYSSAFSVSKNYGKYQDIIVNEDTIVKSTYFKANKDVYTGKITSYNASVVLNAVKSVKGYDRIMQDMGNLNGLPKFINLELNCVIDPQGNLVMVNLIESYTGKITVVIDLDFKSTDNFTYYYKNFNQEPSIKCPL